MPATASQAVALLLPRLARHMPAAARAQLLPGLLKALAADTHWNVRAELPGLLVNVLLLGADEGTPLQLGSAAQETQAPDAAAAEAACGAASAAASAAAAAAAAGAAQPGGALTPEEWHIIM